MKNAIPSLYAIYGRYSDAFRMIPYHLDCLKPVERRVLYSTHDVARKKFVKCARIVGDCIGKYHPHGDQSTYGSLVSLVQRQFIIGQGNFGGGSLKESEPAAFRYTEAKANPIIDKLAFELINFVPWGDPENLQEDQPLYLSSPVPIGLIGDGIISGISFNTTKIPRYTLGDLINRLTYLFKKEIDPNTPPVIIQPYIENCDVYETKPGEFERILETGIGSLTYIPKMVADNDGIHVYGLPPGGGTTWLNRPEDQIYNIEDLSSEFIEVLFTPKPGVLYNQEFINHIFNVIKTQINFKCNVILDNETVHLKSIDELLKNSYEQWVIHLTKKYNDDKSKLNEKLFDLQVIGVIRIIITTHNIKINRIDDIINTFNSSYKNQYPNISDKDIKSMTSKYNIKALVEHAIDTKSIQNQIADIDNILNNIVTHAFGKMQDYIA